MKKLRNLPTLPPFPTFPPCLPLCYQPVRPSEGPTPTPTPTPTVTPTFQPTATPEPTPQDIVVYIDCKNGVNPDVKYSPVNFACFGRGELPKTFSAKVGPVTKSHPDADCSFWPSSEETIGLTRDFVCDFEDGYFVWNSKIYLTGQRISIIGWANRMMRSDPNLDDIDLVYHFSGSDDGKGSCTLDEVTGKITFTMYGTTVTEAFGSAYQCSMPYRVEYEGQLPPEPIPPSPIPTSPPTPLPSKSPTPLPTRSPTPTPLPTKTTTPTPSPSMSPTPTPSPSISPTPTPTPSPT
jgi:hypothetical protein